MSETATIGLVVAAYVLGSIPFGLVLGKLKGVDVRAVGSGNIGATNVARNLGKKLGALVLLLDVLKSAIPTYIAKLLVERGEISVQTLALVAIASIVGHCYPIWLRFRGGKGVATSLGVFLVIDPILAGVGIVVFILLYLVFRIASIGSVAAALLFPILLWASGRPAPLIYLGLAGAAIIIIKHRSNLLRLIGGSENKV